MTDQTQTVVASRESLRQTIDAYQMTQCLYVAAKLGIADLLKDGPRPAEELAQASGAQPSALFRLLRALAAAGVFQQLPDARFALNPAAEYLCRDAPGSLHAWAILAGEQPYPAWGQLLHSVQTGDTAFEHLHGMTHWQYLAANPEASRVFNEAMSENVRASTAAIVAAAEFSRFACIVDVGGGQGTLLAAILRANPAVRGVLLELAQVVPSARELLQAAGLADRCEVVAGSFQEAIPGGGDAYIFKDVLHNWDDATATRILRNCRQARQAGHTLLIIERVFPSGRLALGPALVDLRMLVMIGGRARTVEEYQPLLSAAGFALTRVSPTGTQYQIIEALAVR